jgi:hypothetical protein
MVMQAVERAEGLLGKWSAQRERRVGGHAVPADRLHDRVALESDIPQSEGQRFQDASHGLALACVTSLSSTEFIQPEFRERRARAGFDRAGSACESLRSRQRRNHPPAPGGQGNVSNTDAKRCVVCSCNAPTNDP